MAENTKIEWTESSWNPVRARARQTGKVGWYCSHLTPGCEHCYSEAMNRRLGTGIDFKAQSQAKVELFLDEKILTAPLRWRRPRKVFVCSMTDLFAEFVPEEWIDRIFVVMALCPQHVFQILTKRAQRMRDYLKRYTPMIPLGVFPGRPGPLSNLWVGVSVEDQERADERIPQMLDTPAEVRWVSLEPILGPVDLFNVGEDTGFRFNALCKKEGIGFRGIGLDWVVVGGESGPAARPFKVEWARSVICQCQVAGVPVFMKQLGAVPIIKDVPPFNGSLNGRFESGFPDGTFFGNRTGRRELNGLQVLLRDRKGGDMAEWPPDLRVREYPAQKRARSAA